MAHIQYVRMIRELCTVDIDDETLALWAAGKLEAEELMEKFYPEKTTFIGIVHSELLGVYDGEKRVYREFPTISLTPIGKYEWTCPECSEEHEIHGWAVSNDETIICPQCGIVVSVDPNSYEV